MNENEDVKVKNYWDNIKHIYEEQVESSIRTYGHTIEESDPENDSISLDSRITQTETELVRSLMYLEWVRDAYYMPDERRYKAYRDGCNNGYADGYVYGLEVADENYAGWLTEILENFEEGRIDLGKKKLTTLIHSAEHHFKGIGDKDGKRED